jgi:4-amino-4-deoxy-L-arabinose transferase-like glycosyltransferase
MDDIVWVNKLFPLSSRTGTISLLLFLVVAGFALRVAFTVTYRGGLNKVPVWAIAGADGVEYDTLARRLAAGHGYTWSDGQATAFRAPGFPLAVAGVYLLFGESYPAAYLSFAFMGAVGVVATYLLARELTDPHLALGAALIAAIYPPDIFACSYFFSEALFAPLLGFGLWLVARTGRTGSSWAGLLGGLLLGLTALTRSYAVLFLPLFALWLVVPPPRRWTVAVLFSVGFLAAVLPWTYRNYTVFGRPVLIATNGGSTFYGGNNSVVAGTPHQWGNWVATNGLPGRDLIEAQPDEVAHDQMEYRLGREWVAENPHQFALLGVFKVIRFWLPFVQWPSLKSYPVVNILSTAPFLLLVFAGLAVTLRRKNRVRFAVPHLALLASLFMAVVFWGDPRFRDANVPVLALYATLGGQWVWFRWSRRSVQPAADPDAADATIPVRPPSA